MKAERVAGLLLTVASATLLTACDDGADDRQNRGPSRSETREVGSFDSIDMSGAARLEITIGKPESLAIEGRASSIERVETKVRHNTLFIESKPRDWFMSNNRRRITLKITVPKLDSLQVEGGNDVRLTGFAGGETHIRAAGAAHILADGHLNELTVRMSGAGHGDFSRLIADDAKVIVEGVGSVIVHPKDTLDATMNGVGAIRRMWSRKIRRMRRSIRIRCNPSTRSPSRNPPARVIPPRLSKPGPPTLPAPAGAAAHCALATAPFLPAAPGTKPRRPRTPRPAHHPCTARDCPSAQAAAPLAS